MSHLAARRLDQLATRYSIDISRMIAAGRAPLEADIRMAEWAFLGQRLHVAAPASFGVFLEGAQFLAGVKPWPLGGAWTSWRKRALAVDPRLADYVDGLLNDSRTGARIGGAA